MGIQVLQLILISWQNSQEGFCSLTGEYSPEFYGVILDEIMKAVPQAEKIVVPEAYRVPHIAYAQEYAEIVKSFIAKNAAA